jgi:Protein of unknown function (DUF2934)
MPRAKSPKNGHSRAKQAETVSSPVGNEVAVDEIKVVMSSGDMEAEIRRRAFELYLERGCTPGHESEDWLVAEREILSRNHHTSA